MEKIVFGSRTIQGNPQADWGRDATREKVITAVPLRTWVVLYTNRDRARANDYIGTMLKVCPQMGIDAQPPTRFELRDDRTETFIRALREHINPRVSRIVTLPLVYTHTFTCVCESTHKTAVFASSTDAHCILAACSTCTLGHRFFSSECRVNHTMLEVHVFQHAEKEDRQ